MRDIRDVFLAVLGYRNSLSLDRAILPVVLVGLVSIPGMSSSLSKRDGMRMARKLSLLSRYWKVSLFSAKNVFNAIEGIETSRPTILIFR